jgi:hypothetical protein
MHWALVGAHFSSLGASLSSAIFVVIDAFLIYGIWMGQSRARDIYAGIFALSMLLYFLIAGSKINILHVMLELIALCLLYIGPGAMWFEAEL